MTKSVRIENADTSAYKVKVEVWDKGYPEGEPDKLVEVLSADYPTSMVTSYIHSGRYLKIVEGT
jgi:hypothetical protein